LTPFIYGYPGNNQVKTHCPLICKVCADPEYTFSGYYYTVYGRIPQNFEHVGGGHGVDRLKFLDFATVADDVYLHRLNVFCETLGLCFPTASALKAARSQGFHDFGTFDDDQAFETVWETCNPNQCTHTVNQRRSSIAMLTFIISLLGGLNLVMRLIASMLAGFSPKVQVAREKLHTETMHAIHAQVGRMSRSHLEQEGSQQQLDSVAETPDDEADAENSQEGTGEAAAAPEKAPEEEAPVVVVDLESPAAAEAVAADEEAPVVATEVPPYAVAEEPLVVVVEQPAVAAAAEAEASPVDASQVVIAGVAEEEPAVAADSAAPVVVVEESTLAAEAEKAEGAAAV
jgi:hypothetical protein